jgi:hypothetical protein
MANSLCYSGNLSSSISIDPSPLWVPPRNLASQLPPTPSRVEPIVKSSKDKDVDVDENETTAKDINEVPSISSSLLAIPTTVLSSKEDVNSVLNIIGNVAEGNLEFMESLSYFGVNGTSPSSMMFAVDPQLQSFHHGHQAFSTVKLKVYTYGEICMVLSDPSGHSVIPIPYQNHVESFTECSRIESAHLSFEPTDCETGFASTHLLETDDLYN